MERGWLRRNRWIFLTAAVSAVAVYLISVEVFPYMSANHDESVYLQQADMLTEGKLYLYTSHPDFFRPWFFVQDSDSMYSKYLPGTALLYAAGRTVFGSYDASLVLVAAGSTAAVSLIAREAFDGATAVASAAALVLSPLFLIDSSVYLSYAPAFFFNVWFMYFYIRAVRIRNLVSGVLAGVFVGLGFITRPYTTVLFASPAIIYSLYLLAFRGYLGRNSLFYSLISVAAFGVTGVIATLLYNTVVTGNPMIFPYQEFAPLDGPGFGFRRLLGHSTNYTPALAVESNLRALYRLFTGWVAAGTAGSVTAAYGLSSVSRNDSEGEDGNGEERNGREPGSGGERSGGERSGGERSDDDFSPLGDVTLRWILLGVGVAVVLGNLYFWGTLNSLGDLDDPTDGLLYLYGPYYHFGLLLPYSVFCGHGLVKLKRRLLGKGFKLSASGPVSRFRGGPGVLVFAVLILVFASFSGYVLADGIEKNTEVTGNLEDGYEPFVTPDGGNYRATLEKASGKALVFLPTPYGDWLNHPFQLLRNDPEFGGDTVYALDHGERNFELLDSYGDRDIYRYRYRGIWGPADSKTVEADVESVEPLETDNASEAVVIHVAVNTSYADGLSYRLSTGENQEYGSIPIGENITYLDWVLNGSSAWVKGEGRDRDNQGSEGRDRDNQGRDAGDVAGGVVDEDGELDDSRGDTTFRGKERVSSVERSRLNITDSGTVELELHVSRGFGRSVTYSLEMPYQQRNGSLDYSGVGKTKNESGIRVIAPPRIDSCSFDVDCRGSTAYVEENGSIDVDVSVGTVPRPRP
ncbi:MAG: ArnT family glycosyltransferase [Halobacteria archaeon]